MSRILCKNPVSTAGFIERSSCFFTVLLMVALANLFATPAHSSSAEQLGDWRWSGVERVVVVPDIHGAYPELIELLQASDVIDESLAWRAGTTHMVSLGDILDRGAQSRKVMDLLMRLEREALAAGGRVHVVSGNHETMNLLGDLRYVSREEFAAYSDLESADMLAQAYEELGVQRSEAVALAFLDGGAKRKGRQNLEEQYPPGYFGHRHAFSPEGIYGRWLLSKPAMIVINRTVFVHGGLPAVTATGHINDLNQAYHSDLKRFFQLRPLLSEAGIIAKYDALSNRALTRQALRIADPAACARDERKACRQERRGATEEQRNPGPELLAALKEIIALENSPMFGPSGPLWYRGSVRCKNILEKPLLQSALSNLDADRVVVGHTPTTDRRVHANRDNQLIMLDTGMLTSHYRGRAAALIIEGNSLEVQYLNPIERTAPLGEGGNGFYELTNSLIHEALASGKIVEVRKDWFGSSWEVDLEFQGVALKTVFYPTDARAAGKRELAAYQLDKMLGFDLVPTAAAREIADDMGVIQLSYPDLITEARRKQRRNNTSRWCSIPLQLELLHIFDLLIGNFDRSNGSMGYIEHLWDLRAYEHDQAFGLQHLLPKSARHEDTNLPPSVREALRSLNNENVTQTLGQLLDQEQIKALLARRDVILDFM